MLSLKTVLGQGIYLELLPSLDVPVSAAIAAYPVEGKGLRFSGEVGLEADALERQLLAVSGLPLTAAKIDSCRRTRRCHSRP